MRLTLAIIFLVIDMTSLNLAFSSVPGKKPLDCLECHSKLMEPEYKHTAAVKNCGICHKSNGNTHPAKGEKGFSLAEQTPDLCFSCHDDIQAASREAIHRHPPMTAKKNCMSCHSPHATSEKKLLLAEETKTCLACHNMSVNADNKPVMNIRKNVLTSTYFHGGKTNAGCSACHMPHGSANPFILNGSFPEGIYTSPNKENFLVCFTCHNSDLLLLETTGTATGFRNGTQNLHYLHLQGARSRNCISCHNVHGAMNPQLIAEKVPFGKWEMPIHFVSQENGGTCAPGCHSEKTYKW